jgi:hypothetical protein
MLRLRSAPDRFFADAACHMTAGTAAATSRGLAISVTCLSAKCARSTNVAVCADKASKPYLALRLAAKKAPDICRAFSNCLRCCFVVLAVPFTGTGFPSVRSFRACEVMSAHELADGSKRKRPWTGFEFLSLQLLRQPWRACSLCCSLNAQIRSQTGWL